MIGWFYCFMVLKATFNNISIISWQSVVLVEETGAPWENLPHVTDTLYHIMLYTSPWTGFKFKTLVVIGTDCIDSCKSNYHTITTTTTLWIWRTMWPCKSIFIGVAYFKIWHYQWMEDMINWNIPGLVGIKLSQNIFSTSTCTRKKPIRTIYLIYNELWMEDFLLQVRNLYSIITTDSVWH